MQNIFVRIGSWFTRLVTRDACEYKYIKQTNFIEALVNADASLYVTDYSQDDVGSPVLVATLQPEVVQSLGAEIKEALDKVIQTTVIVDRHGRVVVPVEVVYQRIGRLEGAIAAAAKVLSSETYRKR